MFGAKRLKCVGLFGANFAAPHAITLRCEIRPKVCVTAKCPGLRVPSQAGDTIPPTDRRTSSDGRNLRRSMRAASVPSRTRCGDPPAAMPTLASLRTGSTAISTPEGYRARYNLKPDYPMVALAYSEKRSAMTKTIGLGIRPGSKNAPMAQTKPKSTKG